MALKLFVLTKGTAIALMPENIRFWNVILPDILNYA
jgi:hypothetical protein